MRKLEDKVAIVTGASKGIGASIAKHLAAEGAAVVVNYASSKSGADAVVESITKAGGKAVAGNGAAVGAVRRRALGSVVGPGASSEQVAGAGIRRSGRVG